jgi:hypothetical protein
MADAELIHRDARCEIWLLDGEYFVYGVTRDPRVCHSLNAAYSIAAAA